MRLVPSERLSFVKALKHFLSQLLEIRTSDGGLPDHNRDIRKVAIQDRDGRILGKERVIDDRAEGVVVGATYKT